MVNTLVNSVFFFYNIIEMRCYTLKKTVLITGGSRGIGKETSIEFAKNGYNVVINYVSGEKSALSLKEELE